MTREENDNYLLKDKIYEKHFKFWHGKEKPLKDCMLDAMEDYHYCKVNNLNISDVIKSVCEHKWRSSVNRKNQLYCTRCKGYKDA